MKITIETAVDADGDVTYVLSAEDANGGKGTVNTIRETDARISETVKLTVHKMFVLLEEEVMSVIDKGGK